MKCVKINPNKLEGKINIPPSKSLSHRAIICAALSQGESLIDNLIFSDDIDATCEAMRALGAKIEKTSARSLKISGKFPLEIKEEVLDCKESGSTLRFLIPISLLAEGKVEFQGQGKLVSRPLATYYNIFDQQGIEYKNNKGELPLQLEGSLKPGEFEVEGDISSQFISGLMFTLPLLDGDSKIVIKGELESKGYVDLTIDMLEKFGIKVINKDYKEFIIEGGQKYEARDYRVEGDFSQAAFWLVAGMLGEKIDCRELDLDSLQGDKAILDLILEMGGSLDMKASSVLAKKSHTKGIVIDASEWPDIVPILTVLAAFSQGQTKIVNAARLRIKESDRLKAISTELNKLGADVKELEDGLVINGGKALNGGKVDSWNDHRIAMALAIASIKCQGELTITNSDVVNKSYPHFWEDFKSVGGDIDELNMG